MINFATGNPALLPLLAEAGGDVIGIDWRIELDDAWRTRRPRQGRARQSRSARCCWPTPTKSAAAPSEILDQAAGRPGHIFNLGHGILPQTPVENVIALIDAVREYRR